MLSETPAQIERNTFPDGIVIYVPASAKEAYEEAWYVQSGFGVCIRRNAYCSGERSSLLLQKIEIL